MPRVYETGNGEQLARLLNLSIVQIYNLANSGTIPKSDHGNWNITACAHAYIKYLQGRAGEEKRDYAVERTRLIKLQADKVQLETDILRAELIPAETVKTVWTSILGAVRSRLLSLPGRLGVTGFGAPTIEDLEARAYRLVEEALNELSDFDGSLYRTARARAAHLTRVGDDTTSSTEADDLAVGSGESAPKRRGQRRARKLPA